MAPINDIESEDSSIFSDSSDPVSEEMWVDEQGLPVTSTAAKVVQRFLTKAAWQNQRELEWQMFMDDGEPSYVDSWPISESSQMEWVGSPGVTVKNATTWPMQTMKIKPWQSLRLADPSTLDSFTLKSTKKKSVSNGESEAEPDNLITVKEEAEEEVPIKEPESEDSDGDDDKPKEEEKLPQESKISKTLSERTTKTVIILILIQLFLLPVI